MVDMPTMIDIPYEKQQDTSTDKRCGAASLCMVYRSLGIEVTQDDVWPAISRPKVGKAYTYLIAADAIKRGLTALIVKAKHPWRIIQRAAASNCRVIVNHRIESTTRPGFFSGHYSVLVGCTNEGVVLHDPKDGPRTTIEKTKFLELWDRGYSSEVMGNVLIAIGANDGGARKCTACGARMRSVVQCRCKTEITLSPSAILGCGTVGCTERLWQQIHCPHDDNAIYEVPLGKDAAEETKAN